MENLAEARWEPGNKTNAKSCKGCCKVNVSEELQRYLYDHLRTVPEVLSLAGGRVYDRVPSTNGQVTAQFPYVSFGPVNVIDDFADCVDGETHTIQLDVWSRAVGQGECKNIVDGIRKVLNRSQPEWLKTLWLE
jgi:hypothetical protein